MCIKAVEVNPYMLQDVPNNFKAQEMCEKAVDDCPWLLRFVPDHFKTQEMCNEVVCNRSYTLRFVLDQFVTQQQVEIWHDDDDYCDDDELIKWYDGYKKSKTDKAKIKK